MVIKASELLTDPTHSSAVLALTAVSADRTHLGRTLVAQAHRNRRDRFVYDEIGDHFATPWAVGARRRTYAVRAYDRYAVSVFSSDGKIEMVISAAYRHLERPDVELQRLRAERTPEPCAECPTVEIEIAPFERDIVDLRVSHTGALWVLSSRGAYTPPQGVFQRWDVFDAATGQLSRHVDVVLPSGVYTDPREDRTFWLSDERAVICRRWRDSAWTMVGKSSLRRLAFSHDHDLEVVCIRRIR